MSKLDWQKVCNFVRKWPSDNCNVEDFSAHKQEDIYIRHRYEAHRIIVRQGHVAESFYIVLSGTVMSNVRDGKTPVVQEIKEGGCFGVSCDVN